MSKKQGNSLLETRRRNRVLIKSMIFRTENATRTGIADSLGLTLPTITTSVNEMLSEGILEEVAFLDSQLVNTLGRRPTAIAFRAEAALTIGIELGPYATRAVLMNLRGYVLKSIEEEAANDQYDKMVPRLTALIRELISTAGKNRLLGIGIGLPGFIDREKGIIRSNPRKDWTGKKLVQDLEQELSLPVIIDNNVRLRAIGFEMSEHGTKPDIFAYFYISKGVACPLMVKEDVLTGYTAGAGELGHTVVCINGKNTMVQKCVDDLGSERAIFEKCQEHLLKGGLPELRKKMDMEGRMTMRQILEIQRDGNTEIDDIIAESVEYLGIALANVVNLINPGFVAVDGYLMTNKVNRERLLKSAKSRFYGLNEEEVQIIFTSFDHFCGAKGAGYFVIRKLFLEA